MSVIDTTRSNRRLREYSQIADMSSESRRNRTGNRIGTSGRHSWSHLGESTALCSIWEVIWFHGGTNIGGRYTHEGTEECACSRVELLFLLIPARVSNISQRTTRQETTLSYRIVSSTGRGRLTRAQASVSTSSIESVRRGIYAGRASIR